MIQIFPLGNVWPYMYFSSFKNLFKQSLFSVIALPEAFRAFLWEYLYDSTSSNPSTKVQVTSLNKTVAIIVSTLRSFMSSGNAAGFFLKM